MLQTFLQTYGYLALLIGTFLEGETIAILAGFLAFRGNFVFEYVVAAAFLGTLLGDQFYFYLGRRHGKRWLHRVSRRQERAAVIEARIRRHETLVMLGFRFVYGMRTITPVVLGAVGTSWAKFLLLNFVSALSWAMTVVSLGYYFGAGSEHLLGHLKAYELMAAAAIILVGAVVWTIHFIRARSAK